MSHFQSNAARLIIAVDFHPNPEKEPIAQAQQYLEQVIRALSGLEVTLKINTIARILGARAVEMIHDNGLSCFLDLKLFDIGNTIENDAAWIGYHAPSILTVAERIKPEAFKQVTRLLPKTLVLPVGPLTDLDDGDFRHFGHKGRREAVEDFFNRIWKIGATGAICAPTDIVIAPVGFRNYVTFVTPAVKPEWSLVDDNSVNALTPARAIEAGAHAIVVGRGITAQADMRETARRTLDEMLSVLPSE